MSTVFSNAIVPPELLISDFVNSTQDLSRRQEKTKTFRTAIPEVSLSPVELFYPFSFCLWERCVCDSVLSLQILASCSATSFHIIVGVTFASTSALMPQLEEPNSDIHATKAELAWIGRSWFIQRDDTELVLLWGLKKCCFFVLVSIVFIILPVTSIFAGVFMETFGRLNAVRLAVIPSTVSCIIIALATDVYTIIGGRLLFGIAAGTANSTPTPYHSRLTNLTFCFIQQL